MAAGSSLADWPSVRRVLGAALVIRTRWLVLSMVTAVVAIGALAYWDERQRSEAGLDDLGDEQASVAEAAGLAVATELDAAGHDPSARERARKTLQRLERDGVRVLLAEPGAPWRGRSMATPSRSPGSPRASPAACTCY